MKPISIAIHKRNQINHAFERLASSYIVFIAFVLVSLLICLRKIYVETVFGLQLIIVDIQFSALLFLVIQSSYKRDLS